MHKIEYSRKTKSFRINGIGKLDAFDLIVEKHKGKRCTIELDPDSGEITTLTIEGSNEILKANTEYLNKRTEIKVLKDKEKAYTKDYTNWVASQEDDQDSLFIKQAFIPKDTMSIILGNPDNLNLKLNKLASHFPDDDPKRSKFKSVHFEKKEVKKSFKIKENYGSFGFELLQRKQKNSIESIFGPFYIQIKKKIQWRLIHGLGGVSVYETGITLHHIYGIPFIPSSSIKGITRNWIIQNCFFAKIKDLESEKAGEDAEKLAMKNDLFTYLFGADDNALDGKAKRGHITFFDAYPEQPPVLEPDIINVHYPDYYGKGKAPTDSQNPNPVPFLTIGNKGTNGEDQSFQFYAGTYKNLKVKDVVGEDESHLKDIVMLEGRYRDTLNPESTVLDLIQYWLNDALENHGIGAKTAVGYGYFKGQPI